MYHQLNRLRQDAEELQFFLKRLEKEGESARAKLILDKIEFMSETIDILQKRYDSENLNQETKD